jgi:hypothetical protein
LCYCSWFSDEDLVLGSLVGAAIGLSVIALGSFDGDRVGSLVGDTVGLVVVESVGIGVSVGCDDLLGVTDGLGEIDGNPNGAIVGAEALLLRSLPYSN